MRRALPTLVVALCLVLAGCGGIGGQTADDPGSADTTDTTDTTTDTTDATTGPPASEIVAFDDLEPSAQRVFEAALSGDGSARTANTTDEAFRPFVEVEYVRYDGDLYEVRGQRQMSPQTYVGGVTVVDASELAEDKQVVEYANLSDGAQADFLALLNGKSRTYPLEASPFPGEPIDGPTGYVVYEETYYQLELARGEGLVYLLVVSGADGTE